MKKIHFLFSILLITLAIPKQLTAQIFTGEERIPYFAQYYFNQVSYNPAMAGVAGQPNVGISTRFEKDVVLGAIGNPKTFQAYIHQDFPLFKSAVGMSITYHNFDETFRSVRGERLSSEKRILEIGVMHNYKFELGEDGYVRLGLQGSLLHYNSNEIPFIGPNNPVSQLPTNEKFFKADLDVGFALEMPNWYIAIAVHHVNEPEFRFYSSGTPQIFRRLGYITAAYTYEATEQFSLQPSIMLNTYLGNQGSNNQFDDAVMDVGLVLHYNDFLFAGLNFRTQDSPYKLSLTLGGKWRETYQLSMSYHLKTQKAPNNSRLEATLGFFFNKESEEEYEEVEEF